MIRRAVTLLVLATVAGNLAPIVFGDPDLNNRYVYVKVART